MDLIAVDPGKMCGIRCVDSPHIDWEESEPYETICRVERYLRLLNLSGRMSNLPPPVVVVERYTIVQGSHMTPQYDALEVIGALRWVARYSGAMFQLQSRTVKSRVSNELLRRIDWYETTRGGHANDASRHALVALTELDPTHEIVRRSLVTID